MSKHSMWGGNGQHGDRTEAHQGNRAVVSTKPALTQKAPQGACPRTSDGQAAELAAHSQDT